MKKRNFNLTGKLWKGVFLLLVAEIGLRPSLNQHAGIIPGQNDHPVPFWTPTAFGKSSNASRTPWTIWPIPARGTLAPRTGFGEASFPSSESSWWGSFLERPYFESRGIRGKTGQFRPFRELIGHARKIISPHPYFLFCYPFQGFCLIRFVHR